MVEHTYIYNREARSGTLTLLKNKGERRAVLHLRYILGRARGSGSMVGGGVQAWWGEKEG